MNQLARREVAIVSPHAGTTRDVIEVQLDLDGYPVTVIDTAGIRETDDPVEQEGVRRARARAAEADLVLWLVEDDSHDHAIEGGAPVWMVRNKIDLSAVEPACGRAWGEPGAVRILRFRRRGATECRSWSRRWWGLRKIILARARAG